MATSIVTINNSTYTQVLSGTGFCFSHEDVEYLFAATIPTGDGMSLKPHEQMTGTTGQIIWAKSILSDTSVVFSNPEA